MIGIKFINLKLDEKCELMIMKFKIKNAFKFEEGDELNLTLAGSPLDHAFQQYTDRIKALEEALELATTTSNNNKKVRL